MPVNETDVVIAALLETLNQIRGVIPHGAYLAADANDAVYEDILARIANVYEIAGVKRWREAAQFRTSPPAGARLLGQA